MQLAKAIVIEADAPLSKAVSLIEQNGVGVLSVDEKIERREWQVFVSLLLAGTSREPSPERLSELYQKMLQGGVHHITVELLRESFMALKRDAAPGVDDMTWREYGDGPEERLPDLHERAQSGLYRARPSKRVWITKADGRQRPIGMAVKDGKVWTGTAPGEDPSH